MDGMVKAGDEAGLVDPPNRIGYLTRLAFPSFSRALGGGAAPLGVPSAQWRFLRQVWVEDALTQRELSRRVGMREPTTVTAVNSLVKSGFVERAPSRDDRRKVHINLTQRAKD